MNDEAIDYAAEKSELVKKLFVICQEGKLDEFIRRQIRVLARHARHVKEIHENVFDITPVLEYTVYLRDIAARALPDGHLLAIPRVEIERLYGPQTWTSKQSSTQGR